MMDFLGFCNISLLVCLFSWLLVIVVVVVVVVVAWLLLLFFTFLFFFIDFCEVDLKTASSLLLISAPNFHASQPQWSQHNSDNKY